MDKKVLKAMRSDCHREMWPCYVSFAVKELLSLIIPTLAAWLLGDMTNALLALDLPAIKSRFVPFIIAVMLEAMFLPLIRMLESLLMVRRAGHYEVFLMERLLHRPLSALKGETGATVAEHTIIHVPDYYFIQICKFTLPIACLGYALTVLAVVFSSELHPIFVAAVLLLSAVPLLRTAIIGKLDAKFSAGERTYETQRAKEEEILFNARSFFRVNRLVEKRIEELHKNFKTWYDQYGRRKNNVSATRVVFDYLCSYGTALGVIFVGALLILVGKMTVGSLMTGYLMLPTLTYFYRTISYQLEWLQQEKDSQSRLSVFYGESEHDLHEMEREIPEEYPNAKSICLDRVTFAYPGEDHPVLTNWTGKFSVAEKLCITGENGSGKSTLMRLLAGLYAPQSGTITDENGKSLSKEELRRLVTIQEQDGFIFETTVWENLFAREDQRTKASKLLKSMGFEKPLEYAVSAVASNLSPGERQKVLAVRALLRDSKFLVVDEPLNHMDVAGTDKLLSYFKQRDEGLLIVSHQGMPLAKLGLQTCSLLER